jgi:hypothetical protein
MVKEFANGEPVSAPGRTPVDAVPAEQENAAPLWTGLSLHQLSQTVPPGNGYGAGRLDAGPWPCLSSGSL